MPLPDCLIFTSNLVFTFQSCLNDFGNFDRVWVSVEEGGGRSQENKKMRIDTRHPKFCKSHF